MSSDTLHFLYDENQAMMLGQPASLPYRREILGNLARGAGITWPWGETQSRVRTLAGCAFIVILGGIAPLVGAVTGSVDILFDPGLALERIPAIMMLAWLSTALAFGFGDHLLTQAFLAKLHSEYARHLLQELRKRGKLIAGEVVSSHNLPHGNQQIEYKLVLPERRAVNTYVYVTASQKKLTPGDQVAVLYLNPNIHILL